MKALATPVPIQRLRLKVSGDGGIDDAIARAFVDGRYTSLVINLEVKNEQDRGVYKRVQGFVNAAKVNDKKFTVQMHLTGQDEIQIVLDFAKLDKG